MEEEEFADPLDINKDATVIREAQNDIGKLDVLVCGKCHDVFHYIEEFQDHQEKCDDSSTIKENNKHEPKAQVWAFMLWKNAHFRRDKENEKNSSNASSWAIYQKWCKLDIEQKNAWIKAADFIQNNNKIASARLQEIRTRPVFTEKKKIIKPSVVPVDSALKKEEDPLEEGEIRLNNPTKIKSKARDPLEGVDIRASESDLDTEEEVERELARIHGETDTSKSDKKAIQLNSEVSILPSTRALRTSINRQDKPEEYAVEKIISKRFNPRRRTFEYFIKWENFDSSQNTWEPAAHLSSCKAMVEEFEENLRKQKAAKAAKAAAERKNTSFTETIDRTPGGRPQRTSKQKALKQVKTWCGDISEGDEGSMKRKSFSDDDSSDSFEKRMKMEEDSDTTDEERPVVTIRKVQPKSPGSFNGVAKKTDTTIIPETKIIRLNEKQLPGLSSGVYVMSKTEGIIKLDSNTPVKSGTIMKIAPKIGQTRIKVVKKEDGSMSNIVKVTPTMMQKINRNVIKRDVALPMKPSNQPVKSSAVTVSTIKKGEGGIKLNIIEKPKTDSVVQESEEESDGLEELEFPTDIPIPEPESPPGEFTLDPLTGKLLGQKTPTPPPEPEHNVSETTENGSLETNTVSSDSPSLDNLVKLAAADLTEEDLKADVPVEQGGSGSSTTDINAENSTSSLDALALDSGTIASNEESLSSADKLLSSSGEIGSSEQTIDAVITTVKENASKAPKSKIYSIVPNSSGSSSSILSTALKNSNIKESQPSPTTTGTKKLLSTPHTVRQKVSPYHHQQHVQRTPLVSRVVAPKPSTTTTYIQKVTPGRQPATGSGRGGRTYIQKTVVTPHSHHESSLKRSANVNTYRNTARGNANVARKIGHTTIYRTTPVTQTIAQAKPEETIVLNAADLQDEDVVIEPQIIHQQHAVTTAQGSVISMPLLTDDDSSQSELTTVHVGSEAAGTATTTDVDENTTTLMDVSGFALAEGETPIFITGEDGTIYQVAGQNEDGQTVLITQGPDGQQQCVLVATDGLTEETQTLPATEIAEDETSDLHSPLVVNTDDSQLEAIDNGEESQVVAQIVKADPPSPGGTRKVVLMLPDGNLMMTDVTAEQYAALELDK